MANNSFKNKKHTTLITCIFCLIVGTCLLGISIKEIYDFTTKSNNYTGIDAKVIKHNYKDQKIVSVTLEYTIGDYTYTTTSSNNSDCIKSYGSTIYIKYNPNNPEEIIFVNRGINIIIPVISLVLLSVGLAIIIAEISDNMKRIRYKEKKRYIKTNEQYPKDENNNINNIIDISDVFKRPDPNIKNTKTESKEEIKDDIKEEVISIPFQNKSTKENNLTSTDNTYKEDKEENIHYKDFISEIDDDIPSFIPNIDELNKRKQ